MCLDGSLDAYLWIRLTISVRWFWVDGSVMALFERKNNKVEPVYQKNWNGWNQLSEKISMQKGLTCYFKMVLVIGFE